MDIEDVRKLSAVEFKVYGRMALFSDPLTRVGGEKCSYSVPTYQALKGVIESVYWKPTFWWFIDEVRIMNRIKMHSRGTKLHKMVGNSSDISIYTYLADVCYQVRAHFEFNLFRFDLAEDRDLNKHVGIARRMIEKGGRRDIFLGTRECQSYVEPVRFGSGDGYYDNLPEMPLGTMLHGISYPNETGKPEMQTRFWRPVMERGVIRFIRPDECTLVRTVRKVDDLF